jgi:endoglucanase
VVLSHHLEVWVNTVSKLLRVVVVLLSAACCAGVGSAAEPFTPISAAAQTRALGRGVNVLGYDPVWKDGRATRFQTRHFALIRLAGFRNVRIVLQSFGHMDTDGKLDEVWLATLDTMVRAALDQGLTVILDEHDFNLCSKDAVLCRRNLNAFWSQIAPRFKDAPNRVVFELLNEPHGEITDELWNSMLAETLAIVRSSNPERNVIIGGGHSNGLGSLKQLVLPEADHHIIATFHYYNPMSFTHQGAPWANEKWRSLSNVAWGSEAENKVLNDEFDAARAWSVASGRPVFLGEFGAYDKAPMESRAKWDAAVARAAEAHGISWAYWQFDPDFVLYDFPKQAFVGPILDALIAK